MIIGLQKTLYQHVCPTIRATSLVLRYIMCMWSHYVFSDVIPLIILTIQLKIAMQIFPLDIRHNNLALKKMSMLEFWL